MVDFFNMVTEQSALEVMADLDLPATDLLVAGGISQ